VAGADTILRRLVASADVVVANVPVSALAKMGLDYKSLCAMRPNIILANVSSFGPIGPWAERPGFDSVGQAMCGSAYLSGPGDRPYRSPITWVDHASAVFTAFGVMVALFERAMTGRGQQVDASLMASALAYSGTFILEQAVRNLNRTAIGNRSYLNGPTDTFRTSDGWIVTQVVGDSQFKRWANLMKEPAWLSDPRFATDQLRGDNGAALSERMAKWCEVRSSAAALDELAAAGIPAGPVLSPEQALAHPQVQAMGLFTPTPVPGLDQPVPLAKAPIDLSQTPNRVYRAPPAVGEHTHEILRELGFSVEEIARFRQDRVV
jgi:crotonobetainyl-CoA:carnitine CoA-transferase CaiB-like acyl-CoA transferase